MTESWSCRRYAAVGIPVYLIIDPNDATWHLLQLEGRVYVETAKGIFGQPITFPEPMGFSVQTSTWHPYSAAPSEGESQMRDVAARLADEDLSDEEGAC